MKISLLKKAAFFVVLYVIAHLVTQFLLGPSDDLSRFQLHIRHGISLFIMVLLIKLWVKIQDRYGESIQKIREKIHSAMAPSDTLYLQNRLGDELCHEIVYIVIEEARNKKSDLYIEYDQDGKYAYFYLMKGDKLINLGNYHYEDRVHKFYSDFFNGIRVDIGTEFLYGASTSQEIPIYRLFIWGFYCGHWKDTKELSDLSLYLNLWIESIVQPTFSTFLKLVYHKLY